jgi:arginyl-tRNA synthetase
VTPLDDLRAAVIAAASDLSANGVQPTLERPRKAGFGDYSTNAAMLLAPVVGEPPRDVAGRLGEGVRDRLGDQLERVEVAGPGFLNLFLADSWFVDAARDVLEAGGAWGAATAVERERILVEFVSSNPTGPVHVGHARNAAYGDSLARLLSFEGHEVEREFYVNDAGTQVLKFAESIAARSRGEEPPEDGYRGDYVSELAGEIPGAAAMEAAELAPRAIELMVDRARESLGRFGVCFDHFFSERRLHEGRPSPVSHAYELLSTQGRSFRSEGALWLRTSAFGDDKDRVLERSSGDHTYFASDIAYHQQKRERGYDRLIDVWGADHHGYVRRMQAAWEAMGGRPGALELLIMQFVHLVGRAMSKRAGEFVTLDELVDLIGTDAARWFLLARSHDTTIDLDLDLAREQSAENPVYYVQYAHARMHKIGRDADPVTFSAPVEPLHPSERDLVLKLLAFPAEVAEAADRRAPHRMATYALELAQTFTAFYRDCRVIGGPSPGFRLGLTAATRSVVERSLDLLGIAAPEQM